MVDSTGNSVPLGFAQLSASVGDHIAHFYRGEGEMLDVLGPYIGEGLRRGDRCAVMAPPKLQGALLSWLDTEGLEPERRAEAEQLAVYGGARDAEGMHAMFAQLDRKARDEGYPFVRLAGDSGWAMAQNASSTEMLKWEALYDDVSHDWNMLALCQFDLTVTGGDVVMDALRSHPLCVMGDVVLELPLHTDPAQLLAELAERD